MLQALAAFMPRSLAGFSAGHRRRAHEISRHLAISRGTAGCTTPRRIAGKSPMRRIFKVPVILSVLGFPISVSVAAQDGAALFVENCAPCHNIGEAGGVGPDLRDIAKRRDRAWLLAFVLDPASKDKAATMPPVELRRDAIVTILDYVDSRSAAPLVAGEPAPAPVFTPDDIARGRALFDGTTRFDRGGPACLSCHDAGVDRSLGGGRLGPDLGRLATRLNGPKGTAAWLSSPPTAVMRSVFGDSPLAPAEVHALTAFFVDRVRPDAPASSPRTRRFVALGVAGAAAVLVLIGAAWRGRLRPVRRALVSRAARSRAATATHRQGFRSGGPR